jgi:hypothetical protein
MKERNQQFISEGRSDSRRVRFQDTEFEEKVKCSKAKSF